MSCKNLNDDIYLRRKSTTTTTIPTTKRIRPTTPPATIATGTPACRRLFADPHRRLVILLLRNLVHLCSAMSSFTDLFLKHKHYKFTSF